jgi:hypothetical protein
MSKGALVTKRQHDAAVLANRLLYEIGDDDIWALRAAWLNGYDGVVAKLKTKLIAKYGAEDWPIIVMLVEKS